jgi:hypothetical protein
MVIELDWLNMLVDKGENKGFVIQVDQVCFDHRIPGHLGIVVIDGDILFQARQPLVGQGLLIVEAS